MKSHKVNQNGFTILELIIATTVFSVMLLLASAGIIQIGRIYYKGLITTRTQDTNRAVVDDISRSVQLTGNNTISYSAPGPAQAVCIGTTRYTYRLNVILDDTNPHVLWVDKIIPGGGCSTPPLNQQVPSDHDSNSDNTASGRAIQKELLARNMRLETFNITQVGTTLMQVDARVIYGDTDLTTGTPPECIAINLGGQFCAVSSLNSFVKKRLD